MMRYPPDMIDIREVASDADRSAARDLAQRCFPFPLRLLPGKPKRAYAAWQGDTMVGAVYLKTVRAGSRRVGIVEWIFADASVRGQGVAGVLCDRALGAFAAEGITDVAAAIRDDNTSSWSLFARRGFVNTPFSTAARRWGLGGLLIVLSASYLIVSIGLNLWVGTTDGAGAEAARDGRLPPDGAPRGHNHLPGAARSTGGDIAAFVAVNTGAMAIGAALQYGSGARFMVAAVALVAIGRLLGGWLGAPRGWRFDFSRGGALVLLGNAPFGTWIPMPGFWHPPAARWRVGDERRGAGRSAFGALLAIAVLALMGTILRDAATGAWQTFGAFLRPYALLVLFIDGNPLIDAYGGVRVLRWNRLAYGLLAAAAIAVAIVYR